jgi:hypothetical protein
MYKSLINKLLYVWIVLLLLAWSGLIYCYDNGTVIFASPSDRNPFVLTMLLIGSLLGISALLAAVGLWVYVYRDSGLRGMNQLLWTLIAIFTPNMLGIIIYFIVRKPLLMGCPNCSAQVDPQLIHCPHCGKPLKKKCPTCNAVLENNFLYCGTCGKGVDAL